MAVRLRRDWNAVSSLIKAHAIMHQRSRETSGGQIVADLYDYTAVRSLVSDLVADAVGATVPASVRETVEAVTRLDNGFGATVAAVARELEIERSAASRRLATARDRGYLVNQEEKRGKPARYKPGEPMPGEDVLLPAPEDVCTGACTHAGLSETPVQECDCTGVCRCAGIAGGIESAGDAWAPCAPGVPAPAVAAPEVPAPAAAPLRCDAKVKKASGTSDGGCPQPAKRYAAGTYCTRHARMMGAKEE